MLHKVKLLFMIDNVDMSFSRREKIVSEIIAYEILVIRALHPMVLAGKHKHVKHLSLPYKGVGKAVGA